MILHVLFALGLLPCQ